MSTTTSIGDMKTPGLKAGQPGPGSVKPPVYQPEKAGLAATKEPGISPGQGPAGSAVTVYKPEQAGLGQSKPNQDGPGMGWAGAATVVNLNDTVTNLAYGASLYLNQQQQERELFKVHPNK